MLNLALHLSCQTRTELLCFYTVDMYMACKGPLCMQQTKAHPWRKESLCEGVTDQVPWLFHGLTLAKLQPMKAAHSLPHHRWAEERKL